MVPHPAATSCPKAFWRFDHPTDAALRHHPAVHVYRPDWFADSIQEPPLPGSPAWATAYAHPACACELLRKAYSTMAATMEPALNRSAEYTFRLLGSLSGEYIAGRRQHYRQIFLESPHWAALYVKAYGDVNFDPIINEWSAANRDRSAGAAAWHVIHHPKESVGAYRDLFQEHPDQVYWALPELHSRGFRMRASDQMQPKWAYHLALNQFSRGNGDYLPALGRDPVWLVGYLLARDRRLDPRVAADTAARLREEHGAHPLLPRALTALGAAPAPEIPSVLAAGQQAELHALERLQRGKNRAVYRPTMEQVQSELFKQIVGPPRYTERGYAKGTVMDVVDGEFAEIKSGRSVLEPTYQLRLQAFRAVEQKQVLRIYTNRPLSPQFAAKILQQGVAVERLPD